MKLRSFLFSALLCFAQGLDARIPPRPSAAETAFARADFDAAFSDYLLQASRAKTPEEALLRTGQAWLLRAETSRADSLTNILTGLTARSNNLVRFLCDDLLSRFWFERGRTDRVKEILSRVTLLTQWTLSGSYNRLGGRADFDFPFPPEFLPLMPAFSNELVSHPPLPLSPANLLGELAPYEQVVPSSGTVYLETFPDLPREGNYLLYIESDESFKIFIGEKEVFQRFAPDGAEGRLTLLRLFFPSGRTRLLIKITDVTRKPVLRVILMNPSFGPATESLPDSDSASRQTVEQPLFSAPADNLFLSALAARLEGRNNDFHKAFLRMEGSVPPIPSVACFYAASVLYDSSEHPNSGRTARALRLLRETRTAATPLGQALQGLYYAQRDMTEEALARYAQAVALNSNAAFPLLLQADLFKTKKWKNEFSSAIQRALRIHPSSVRARTLLADYQKEHAPEEAAGTYRRLAALAPSGTEALDAVRFFLSADFSEDAEKTLAAYRILNSQSVPALLLAADLEARLCRPIEAEKILEDFERRTAGRPDILLRLASLRSGKPAVRKTLERALSLSPADIRIADMLSLLDTSGVLTREDALDPALRAAALKTFFSSPAPEGPPAEILLNEEVLFLNRDGTWASVSRQIVRIIDKKGIQIWGNPAVEALTGLRVLAARTILKSGEEIDAPRPRRQEDRLVFSFPAVEEDCLIEMTTFTPGRWNGMNATLFHESFPRYLGMVDQPVRRFHHTLLAPAGLGFTVETEGFPPSPSGITTHPAVDRIIRSVIQASNLNAVRKEAHLPPLSRLVPSYKVVRPAGSFADLGLWYSSLISSSLAVSPDLNDLLMSLSENRELTRRGLNLIAHLYDWIGREIRTARGGLYSPRPLRAVCDQRQATTEEKTLLMKYFLDRMDVPNRILLTRANYRPAPGTALPAPGLFDEPVLSFLWEGKTRYLDMSSRWLPFGTMGWEKHGAVALDTESGEIRSLPGPNGQDILTVTNFVTVLPDRILLSGQRHYEGYFGLYGELFADLSSRDSQINHMENQGIRGFTVTNIVYPGRDAVPGYRIEGFSEGFGARYGGERHIPIAGRYAALAERFLSSVTRENDLWISVPLRMRQTTVYDLSRLEGKQTLLLPQDVLLTGQAGVFRLVWREDPENRVTAETFVDIPAGFVKAADYEDFVRFCSEADRREKIPMVLKTE